VASNWNRFTERLAEASLTGREARVLASVARLTLGYAKPRDTIAASQLAKLTGIARNHVAECLASLEHRGLITRTSNGRGRPAAIALNLVKTREPVPPKGHPNLPRAQDTSTTRKGVPQKGSKPVPSTGHTKEKGVKQHQPPAGTTFQNRLADSYLAAGGSLELAAWRGALFRNAATLLKAGNDEHGILDAARSLGRERAFPGLLKQRHDELAQQGGLCQWHGLDPSRLTTSQLLECGCGKCTQWAQHLPAVTHTTAA
jgi:phage replication O-like protein O